VLGLLDGAPSPASQLAPGSGADLVRRLGLDWIAVLDARGSAQSLGAVALGLAVVLGRRPLGVVANRVASQRHAELVREGIERVGLPFLGAIEEGRFAGLERRHLGLVDPDELTGAEAWLARAASAVEESVELDALLGVAHALAPVDPQLRAGSVSVPVAVSIGPSARFRYEENLLRLEAAGAELLPFDPLEEAPPPSARLIWLHGGYPELFGAELAANKPLHDVLRASAARGVAMVAECGGYALLAERIGEHPMAGVVSVRMELAKRAELGYRWLRGGPGPLGRRPLPAHEFHYLRAVGDPGELDVVDARGTPRRGGIVRPRVLASFLHLHLGADPELAPALVAWAAAGPAVSSARDGARALRRRMLP